MFAPLEKARDRSLSLLRRVEWTGPLLVRLTLGVVFVMTGWTKLHDLDHTTQFFASLHIPAAHANAVFVGVVEFVGGLALILGLGTRIAALFLIGVMTVAILTDRLPRLHGIVDLASTIEVAYLAAFVWLGVAGAGKASLDHLLSHLHKHEDTSDKHGDRLIDGVPHRA